MLAKLNFQQPFHQSSVTYDPSEIILVYISSYYQCWKQLLFSGFFDEQKVEENRLFVK